MIAATLNQKGGVGKTTTVFNLAGALAEHGARVLVVDFDPQASLTQAFLGPEATADLDPWSTVYSVLANASPAAESIIRRTLFERIDLIAGSLQVDQFNTPIGRDGSDFSTSAEGLTDLRRCLRGAVGYDAILIDCPPNIARCTASSLLAADLALIPVQPEDFGAQGITAVEAAIGWARALTNPGLRLCGYLATMVDTRTALHKHYLESLRLAKGSALFSTVVPRSIDFPEAVMRRAPITLAKPRSKAAEAMRAVAGEFLGRACPGLPGDVSPAASTLLDRARAFAAGGA